MKPDVYKPLMHQIKAKEKNGGGGEGKYAVYDLETVDLEITSVPSHITSHTTGQL